MAPINKEKIPVMTGAWRYQCLLLVLSVLSLQFLRILATGF